MGFRVYARSMATPESRAEHAGEHFKVEFICTCGEKHTEYFLTNNESRSELLRLVMALLDKGVNDMTVTKVTPETVEDHTIAVMLAVTILLIDDLYG